MTTLAGAYEDLPAELKAARQWCVAGPDRAPYCVLPSGNIVNVSVHKRELWKTFDDAYYDASRIGNGASVGLMLTYEDPWTCIDLDVVNKESQERKKQAVDESKWTKQEELDRYAKILLHFDSYAEHSSGGYGIHIWVRGRIGTGARRDGVEVYSQERFIVCTGKAVPGYRKPIAERQALLDLLVEELRTASGDSRIKLEELEPEDSDMEVFERACSAENADKFNDLCAGKWKELGFPSQSEADLALLSIFAFYTRSNSQCRQLFRCTSLGQREKAVKNDRYLNFTLEVIRGRQARDAIIDDAARRDGEELARQLSGAGSQADVSAAALAVSQNRPPKVEGTLDWPPGFAGTIAAFIYNSAPRPVKEVAIVGALGLLAGICGKAFTIHQSGLNAYIILVARSGIGKEAMHSGISLILNELRGSVPAAERFVDFTDYVSGPALKKAIAANPSFCSVSGEFGRKLRRLADDNMDGPMASLRTVMTDLYQKSSPSSLVGGMGYSDKEKNVTTSKGVAYSMIGESTPGTFYDSLSKTMMEDGFLSRFTIIDYTGERPPENKNQITTMDPAMAQGLQGICSQALNLISLHSHQPVPFDNEAMHILDAFSIECDNEINTSSDESYRQMWNRAHLKVKRFAALLAVADNCINPVATKAYTEWALMLVRRDINIMNSRLESGDVGADDTSRERKMVAVLREYLQEGVHSAAYGDHDSLRKKGIVTKRFLQMRLCKISCFCNARNGATWNVDQTCKSMIEMGFLAEVDKKYLVEKHNFQGKAFRVVSLPPTH